MKRLLLVSAIVLVPAVAYAQPANPPSNPAAEGLYKEAVDLFKAGDVPKACAKLDESFKLAPVTQTLFSLAKCREREGKLATAWTHFTELVTRAQKEQQKDKEAQMQAKVTELGPRVPKVALKLDTHPDVSDVTIDGKSIGRAQWGSTVPLDPGEHVVLVKRTFSGNIERKLTLKEKDIVTIEIEAGTGAPPPPPPDEQNKPPPDMPISNADEGGHRTLGYILGGVGIASIAAGSIFGVVAIGQKSDADDKFAARDPGFKDSDNSASTSALVSTILFGVGIVGLGAGAYFVLTAPSKKTASAISRRAGSHADTPFLRSVVNRVERGALLW